VGTEAMFITSSKTLCKKILAAAGIPTPRWFTPEMLADHVAPMSGRYIIKSVWEEASVGLDDDSVQDFIEPAELLADMRLRQPRLGGSAFAEAYIDGREFNLSLLGGDNRVQVMPPAEIEFVNYAADKPRIVGYSAKWREDSPEYRNTPRTFDFADGDRALLADLMALAKRCWDLLGLRGYARVDFRVDGQGRPWVLEVNANPCLSPDAGFVAAVGRAGLAMPEVVRRLIEDAFGNVNLKSQISNLRSQISNFKHERCAQGPPI
jgi:D-alanine-D-alanine ligase